MSTDVSALKPFIATVTAAKALDFAAAETAFTVIMEGRATPVQIAAFLVALRMRGETVDEISAAASVIRRKALPIKAPAQAMDIVGTGGDGLGTLNISTAAALVTAACGVPIAKHGNRAVSSLTGTADVQTRLGININADFALIEQSLRETNFGFLLAPRHHECFKYVAPVRAELGIRTVFNILGPLCNPAGVKKLLLGVYAPEWVRPVAETLARLGCEKAWVVHGAGGLDELSTLGPNKVCVVTGTEVQEIEVLPEDAGLNRTTLESIKGADSTYNAERLSALLDGTRDAYREIVLFSAAAALLIAGKVQGLKEGVSMAQLAIDKGLARQVLEDLKRITNSFLQE